MSRSFEDAVIEIVDGIPSGETSTYGEVAEEAGFPGAARAVGNVMRTVPGLPWWRVITTTGRLVPGLEIEHTQRLRSEGILVTNGRVRLGGTH
jgi:methylated-DNA-protein-cysteine methyltransferase-like protein